MARYITASTMRSLVQTSFKQGFRTWKEVQEYAARYKKYDDLTFRDIDRVMANLGVMYNDELLKAEYPLTHA